MNWQNFAVDRLRDYRARALAVETIPDRIRLLELEFQGIRAASTDRVPSRSGASRRDDALVSNIAAREELKRNYAIARRETALTRKGLDALSEQERRVLEGFYVDRQRGHVERLCEELCVEKSKIYQIKDDALRKFTMACYAVVEI